MINPINIMFEPPQLYWNAGVGLVVFFYMMFYKEKGVE